MRTRAIASALSLALAAGIAGGRAGTAEDGMDQAQVRALEAQIQQLVERVCGLEATLERLRQQGCAVDLRPATTTEPEPAKPDPWCAPIEDSNAH